MENPMIVADPCKPCGAADRRIRGGGDERQQGGQRGRREHVTGDEGALPFCLPPCAGGDQVRWMRDGECTAIGTRTLPGDSLVDPELGDAMCLQLADYRCINIEADRL